MQVITPSLSYLLGPIPCGMLLALLFTGQGTHVIGADTLAPPTPCSRRPISSPSLINIVNSATGVWMTRWLAPG